MNGEAAPARTGPDERAGPGAAASGVTLSGLRKSYGSFAAVQGVDLAVAAGEMICLLGPSGCGKTTTLRMVAGLEEPDEGRILIGSRDVTAVPPWRRRIGMVFQNYALFPHMTVAQNVGFGLKMRGMERARAQRQVAAALDQVRLADLGHRRPSQLSGGQRQRVALARAIVTEPDVLLFDEPLAALDRKLREEMQVEIKNIQRRVGITTIFVTHDQEEALVLADRIVVMDTGRIVQVGPPAQVYERPDTRFVSDFIGVTNALAAEVLAVACGTATARLRSGHVVDVPAGRLVAGQTVELVIRPEKVTIGVPAASGMTSVEATIVHVVYVGSVTYYHAKLGPGTTLIAMVSNTTAGGAEALVAGRPVTLGWDPASVLVYPV